MTQVKTRLGELEIDEKDIIDFPEGLPGFEYLHRYVLIQDERTDPIKWLVSVEDENVSLPVIDPWLVRVDYTVEVSPADKRLLKLENVKDALVMCVVVIPKNEPENATINLLAPVIINIRENIGKQIILDDPNYTIRHRIVDEMERSRKIISQQDVKTGAGTESEA
ncbi:MAG: flagellar assembly factor FliW [Thermotogota bacterium]|nr:flagellar assembly factor FliW [Thermotogota bacterium]MDK2864398.1 flagellar assembly factor FliW [Thermotogota bacterium]HCZ05919.1 flagellar assembly protein FliW [Thermotogota bacterium]